MATQVTVRPAEDGDLPAILAIYNDAVLTTTATYDTEPEPLAKRASWLADRRAQHMPVLVAVSKDSVVGFAALSPYSPKPGYRHTVSNTVYVAAGARGEGIGTALLAALVRRAREMGAHVILASIDAENLASVALHRSAGFRKVAHFHEVGHKFGRWLDVVHMQLTLDEPEPLSKYARRAPSRSTGVPTGRSP
ncbi:MAG TPA: GNAT family N-acetyltransferase [Candidatus Thermoplasmatota archaeon]|nr:GNAT family N-acetyltransferase [Candidatus Thermoplasmatota archaeon]